MEDLATEKPGPMGWGVDEVTNRLDAEVAFTETFQAGDPQFYMRNPAKAVVNEPALKEIRELQAKDGIEDGIELGTIEKWVFGAELQWLAQIIGSCVGSSFMRIAATRMLWEAFVLGEPEEVFGTKLIGTNNVAPFAPYGYRAGRKLGGLNGGDGSFCSVQIRGAKEYGILPCSAEGLVSDAFPEPQSASTYRQMGNSNSFLEKFKPQGVKHKLIESEQVREAGTAKMLLCEHFKPLQICSMWAFTPSYTHANWTLEDGSQVVIYKRDTRTSWAHAMSVMGCVMVAGNWFVKIKNSWGNAHRNGDYFWITLELFDQWLRDAECMSVGDIDMTDNVLPGDA